MACNRIMSLRNDWYPHRLSPNGSFVACKSCALNLPHRAWSDAYAFVYVISIAKVWEFRFSGDLTSAPDTCKAVSSVHLNVTGTDSCSAINVFPFSSASGSLAARMEICVFKLVPVPQSLEKMIALYWPDGEPTVWWPMILHPRACSDECTPPMFPFRKNSVENNTTIEKIIFMIGIYSYKGQVWRYGSYGKQRVLRPAGYPGITPLPVMHL